MNLIIAKSEGGRARIEIKGEISKWRDTEAEFTAQVDKLVESGVKDVHIYINSPGGECFEANEIVNVIKRFPGRITGEGGAMVASAATYIAIHCSEFSMPENGLFMIHQVSGGICGRVSDVERYAELMKKLNEHYLNAFLDRCTDKKKLKEEWNKGDYWMTAREAKEQGFVTSITGKTKIDKATATAIMNCGYAGTIEVTDTDEILLHNSNQMDVKMLANRLGMSDTSTEAQVLAQIDVYRRKAERTEMLEKREQERIDQAIDELLNTAIRDKKITADVKDEWRGILCDDFERGKKMLDAIKPVQMPDVKPAKAGGSSGKKWEDLQDDPAALQKLMDENPKEYERLLNDFVNRSR